MRVNAMEEMSRMNALVAELIEIRARFQATAMNVRQKKKTIPIAVRRWPMARLLIEMFAGLHQGKYLNGSRTCAILV